MTGVEQFRYDGKHALVVGGATGMGAAAAQIVRDLGATVTVMDYALTKTRLVVTRGLGTLLPPGVRFCTARPRSVQDCLS